MKKNIDRKKIMAISGFPEFLPSQQRLFSSLIRRLEKLFRSYGFSGLDTPIVERASVLQAKGNDHEIYGLYRLADPSAAVQMIQKSAEQNTADWSDILALRFDLTVPLARYVTEHQSHLTFPFKRYHIGPVFRGERPQKGRYRQFYQGDFDVIGQNSLSLNHEGELISMARDAFRVLGIERVTMRLNHRKILMGLLRFLGTAEECQLDLMRLVDKALKIPAETFETAALKLGLSSESALFLRKHLYEPQSWTIDQLKTMCADPDFQQGVEDLSVVLSQVSVDQEKDFFKIDPFLARGLTYYTGLVCEAEWQDHPDLGTICAGGRYDNLCQTLSGEKFPGFGLSLGLSRLISRLLEVPNQELQPDADILITVQSAQCLTQYLALAREWRAKGLDVDIYLNERDLGVQMKYAARKNFALVFIADENELSQGKGQVRDMRKRQQTEMLLTQVPEYVLEYTKTLSS
jgi:histidyl-tRNA synthetase